MGDSGLSGNAAMRDGGVLPCRSRYRRDERLGLRWSIAPTFHHYIILLAAALLFVDFGCVLVTAKNVPHLDYEPVQLLLENKSPCTLEVYWINPDTNEGTRMSHPRLLPGETFNLDSYEGHEFEVRNVRGKCCGGSKSSECRRINSFVMTDEPTQVILIEDGLEFVHKMDETDNNDNGGETEGRRKTGRNRITRHAMMTRQTLVNLHDLDLEENRDLDLAVEDPNEAAKQVLDRIGVNVSITLSFLP